MTTPLKDVNRHPEHGDTDYRQVHGFVKEPDNSQETQQQAAGNDSANTKGTA